MPRGQLRGSSDKRGDVRYAGSDAALFVLGLRSPRTPAFGLSSRQPFGNWADSGEPSLDNTDDFAGSPKADASCAQRCGARQLRTRTYHQS